MINTSVQNIKTIYHISDIHIRKNERHLEYMEVFTRLVNRIRIDNYRESLIVMTGDIMHDKSEMVPESIDLLKKFLLMLSDITEIVVIIGNHDINQNNINSMDCLTPIVDNLMTKNKIHLLKENRLYVIESQKILFGLTDLWSKEVTPVSECYTDYLKIGLYHGMIHGSTLDNGMTNNFSNQKLFNQTDFLTQYDIVLLGDIHKHQYLDKDHRIAYAGSLIQQKRDEDLLEHGMICWNIGNRREIESNHIRIPNNYGIVGMTITKDGFSSYEEFEEKYQIKTFPHNLDLMISYDSMETKHNQMVVGCIQKLINNHRITRLNQMVLNNLKISNTLDRSIIGKSSSDKKLVVTDNNSVKNIILQYILNKHKYEGQKLKNIGKEITKILDSIGFNYENQIKSIDLVDIRFSNMMAYGENNYVDFTKFKNIMGLNAPNYSGKSSLIDIVLYSLYGKSSRGGRFDMMRIGEKKMNSRLRIKCNHSIYCIVRSGMVNSEKKRDLKESLKFYELDKDDQILADHTCDDRVKTQKKIENIICSYEQMVNLTIVLQKNGMSFSTLNENEKRDLLCGIARLNVFDKIASEVKSKYCSTIQMLSRIQKKHQDQTIDMKKNNLQKIINCSLLNKKKLHSIDLMINRYKSKTRDMNSHHLMKDPDNSINRHDKVNYLKIIRDMDRLYELRKMSDDRKHISIDRQLIEYYSSLKTTTGNRYRDDHLDILHRTVEQLTEQINHIHILPDDILMIYEKYRSTSELIGCLKKEIIDLTEEKARLIERKKEIEEHQYDPQCPKCMSNPVTINLLKIERSIEMVEIQSVQSICRLDELIELIDNLQYNQRNVLDCWNENNQNIERLNTLNNQRNEIQNIIFNRRIEAKIQALKEMEKLEHMIELIDRIKDDDDDISDHHQIISNMEHMIDRLNVEKNMDVIKNLEKKKNVMESEQMKNEQLIMEIQYISRRLSEYNEEIKELENTKAILGVIKETLEKDGLVERILKNNIIPYLEEEINLVLNRVGVFKIKIVYLNRSITIYKENGLSLEMSSGYETYLMDLVFRFAIQNINRLIRINHTIIDEGFGSCDDQNKVNIRNLLEMMREKYDWILIISHDSYIKNFYDHSIGIQKTKDGVSKIIFGSDHRD